MTLLCVEDVRLDEADSDAEASFSDSKGGAASVRARRKDFGARNVFIYIERRKPN